MPIPWNFKDFTPFVQRPAGVTVRELKADMSLPDDMPIVVTTDAWPVGLVSLNTVGDTEFDARIGDVEIPPAFSVTITDEGLSDDTLINMIETIHRRRTAGYVVVKDGAMVGILTAGNIIRGISPSRMNDLQSFMTGFIVYECEDGHREYFAVAPATPPTCVDGKPMHRV